MESFCVDLVRLRNGSSAIAAWDLVDKWSHQRWMRALYVASTSVRTVEDREADHLNTGKLLDRLQSK